MKKRERGFVFPMVLILLVVGSMTIAPSLMLASSAMNAKDTHTDILRDQYARDGAAEYGAWQLLYGDVLDSLGEDDPGDYVIELNDIEVDVAIWMRTELGLNEVPGAGDEKIKPSKTVDCGIYDCSDVPKGEYVTYTYTITVEQLNPEVDGLTAIYDELPTGFDYEAGTTSWDEQEWGIATFDPTNIGSSQNPILKWAFSPAITFAQGDDRTMTFQATATKQGGIYANAVYLMPNQEKTGKTAFIIVDAPQTGGVSGGGVLASKYVDQAVAPPGVTTTFTYTIIISSESGNVLHVDAIKDVLPVDFIYLPGTTDILTTDDPDLTWLEDSGRWELWWDGPGGAGWSIDAKGGPGDTLTLEFQAEITPTESGSYFNECYAIISGCSAPNALISEGVTSNDEYCTMYSWPSGGTVVPMYDVESQSERTTGRGNIDINLWDDEATIESWHIENNSDLPTPSPSPTP
ncbi:hypothetical protein ACFLVI_02490 [Chloroflexota bacterium]